MPIYDFKCSYCGIVEEQFVQNRFVVARCRGCGGQTEKVWVSKAPFVVPDSIDFMAENGLCHSDGTPRHFGSRGDLARAAKEAGLINRVKHAPPPGTDKSRHTTSWSGPMRPPHRFEMPDVKVTMKKMTQKASDDAEKTRAKTLADSWTQMMLRREMDKAT